MDKKDIKKMIDDSILDYMNKKQYTVSKIPNHLHNGTDSVQISQIDLIPSPQYAGFLLENVSETIQLTGLPNIRKVRFDGIAYDSSASPAQKKGTCSGEAILTPTYSFNNFVGTTASVNTAQAYSVFQSYNSTYFDTTTLANLTVSAGYGTTPATLGGDPYFLKLVNNAGTTVASLSVVSYSKGIVTITTTVAANWIIKGTLVFS